MGRLTQFIDYLTRPPDEFSKELVIYHYTHISITPSMKETRRTLRLYNKKKTPDGSPGPVPEWLVSDVPF